MGIKHFSQILKIANSGEGEKAVYNALYSDFKGQSWAIDASIFCCRFSYASDRKRKNSHIDGFYQLFRKLIQFGITPILVLDGHAPQEKKLTIENRLKLKQRNIDKCDQLKEEIKQLNEDENISLDQIKSKQDELEHVNKQIIRFSPTMYEDIYNLCNIMGVQCVKAKGEADVLCANMSKSGIVQAIMSEDSDMILYGGERLIRKFNWTNEIEVIELKRILNALKLTYQQFVDLAILSGTDYNCKTISGLGVYNAYGMIANGMNIEQIIEGIKSGKYSNYKLPIDSDFQYQNTRDLILGACNNEPINISIIPAKIDWIALSKLLTEYCNYQQSTVQKHHDQSIAILASINKPKLKLVFKKK